MAENDVSIESLAGLVVFVLGKTEYCADINDITAIINPNNLKDPVDFNNEILSVRINKLVIPLIDLHKYFNVKGTGKNEDKRILAVEPVDVIFGFVADRITEIFTMNSQLKEKLGFTSGGTVPFLRGILHFEGRQLYLPDLISLAKYVNGKKDIEI